jgi:hypothetical protein
MVLSECLSANADRMHEASAGHPFGPLEARLAALQSMRRATKALYAVLDPGQRHRALLPLCCLQEAAV